MIFPTWPNMNVALVTDEDYSALDETCAALGITPEAQPEICPEVWQKEKPDADRCIEAVRAMCK